jgi:transcriptional regulator with GAF, ATPase, and Fis domain
MGKEMSAEYNLRRCNRSHYPLVKVGLATLPPNLIESELFGHEKGELINKKKRFE